MSAKSTKEKPYKIPPDNPFLTSDDGSLGEIWAYGFRNPWLFSFDRETQKMYLGDVGANSAEEVALGINTKFSLHNIIYRHSLKIPRKSAIYFPCKSNRRASINIPPCHRTRNYSRKRCNR